MEKKEKIRKVYQKHDIYVNDETLEEILKDKKRTKKLIRVYKQEEIDSMNYILGKPDDNKIFTKEELELMNTIDLFDRKLVNICKTIWDNEMKAGVVKCI